MSERCNTAESTIELIWRIREVLYSTLVIRTYAISFTRKKQKDIKFNSRPQRRTYRADEHEKLTVDAARTYCTRPRDMEIQVGTPSINWGLSPGFDVFRISEDDDVMAPPSSIEQLHPSKRKEKFHSRIVKSVRMRTHLLDGTSRFGRCSTTRSSSGSASTPIRAPC